MDLGIQEQGYELSWQTVFEDVQESDAYGAMLIESIYRGVTNVGLMFTALEYKDATLAVATQYAPMLAAGARSFGPGTVGRRATDAAATVVLTATGGTPAAASPASLTAALVSIGPQAARLVLNSKLRKLPLQTRIYPYNDSGTVKFFTTT